jgi:hypothetical protein
VRAKVRPEGSRLPPWPRPWYWPGLPVRCLPGDDRNIKITYPHDLVIARMTLS